MHRLCLTPCFSIQTHQHSLFYISPQFISRSLLYFAILYSAVKSPADFVWHFAEINPNSASLRPGFNSHFWPPWFTTKYFAQTMQLNTIIWGSLQNTSFYTILKTFFLSLLLAVPGIKTMFHIDFIWYKNMRDIPQYFPNIM